MHEETTLLPESGQKHGSQHVDFSTVRTNDTSKRHEQKSCTDRHLLVNERPVRVKISVGFKEFAQFSEVFICGMSWCHGVGPDWSPVFQDVFMAHGVEYIGSIFPDVLGYDGTTGMTGDEVCDVIPLPVYANQLPVFFAVRKLPSRHDFRFGRRFRLNVVFPVNWQPLLGLGRHRRRHRYTLLGRTIILN